MTAALRHLMRNRGRSILTLLAVLIPVYFLVFMFGFVNSIMRDMFDTATRIDTGHFQIRHEQESGMGSALPLMYDAEALVASLDEIEGVEWRTIRLDLPALASAGDHSQTIYLQGVVPEEIGPISTIEQLVVAGTYLRTSEDGIVIGRELADTLAVGVGDEVVLLGAHPEAGIAVLKVPVTGIYEAPLAEMGRTVAHIPLETARRLARSPNAATAVVARVAGVDGPWSLDTIEAVTEQLASALPTGLVVLDWRDLAPQVAAYLRIIHPFMIVIAAIFFGLGALVVLNTLYLSVMERTHELGLILSLGASRWRVIRMILTEAGLIAIVGAIYGALIGAALVWIIQLIGGIPLPGAYADFMRAVGIRPVIGVMLMWPQVILSALAMAAVAVVAAWFPAYRASRLEPVEAMRYVE